MDEIVREMTREELIAENNKLRDMIVDLKGEIDDTINARDVREGRLLGEIEGLKSAIRCNGVSGAEVDRHG